MANTLKNSHFFPQTKKCSKLKNSSPPPPPPPHANNPSLCSRQKSEYPPLPPTLPQLTHWCTTMENVVPTNNIRANTGLAVYVLMYLPILSIYLSIYLSMHPSIHPSIHLSIYLYPGYSDTVPLYHTCPLDVQFTTCSLQDE